MYRRILLTGGVLCLLAISGAADVVLHPGYVTGTVGLSHWTFDNGSVSVYGNASGFAGSTSFGSAGSYTVTVEGGQTYNSISQSLWTYSPSYTSFNLNINTPFLVGVGAAVTQNLYAPGATVRVGATAAGATINMIYAQASGSSSSTSSFYGTAYGYSGAAAPVPVAATTSSVNVSAYVYMTLNDANGNSCPVYRSYNTTIAGGVAEGATADITQSFDLSGETCVTDKGSIAGTIELRSLPAGVTPSGRIYFSGPEYRDLPFSANPFAYLADNLLVGSYYTQVYANFNAPYESTLYFPNGGNYNTNVTANSTTVRDFVHDAGTVSGTVTMTGPLASPDPLDTRYMYFTPDYSQPWPFPNYGGSSSVRLPAGASGSFGAILTTGKWLLNHNANLYVRDAGGAIREFVYFGESHGGTPIDITAGGALTLNPTLETSVGDLVFDVLEGAGQSPVLISYPRATFQMYDAATGRNAYISASSNEQNNATPTLKVIGPPGHYTFDAYATVNNSNTKFVSGSINLGLPTNTPQGSNVQVPLQDANGNGLDVNLTFNEVTLAGDTSASTTDVGPAPPGSFQILPAFGGSKFLSISTTASFTPPVTIAVEYDPVQLGIPPAMEPFLQLWHYNCESAPCFWEMINDPPPPSPINPDTVNNVITGKTNSFSVFALMLPPSTNNPPDVLCVGTAAAPKIISMPQDACSLTASPANGLAGTCADGSGDVASCTLNGFAELSLTLGTHEIVVEGTSGSGASAQCTSYVRVVDASAPSVDLVVSPSVLWPANHKLIPIQLTKTASDSCDAQPVTSCSVTSNQAANGRGDGNTSADVVWENGQLFVRAERSGNDGDRVYTITCTALDAAGNSSSATATVTVPHNR